MASVARLVAELDIDTRKFSSGLRKAKSSASGLSREFGGASRGAGSLGNSLRSLMQGRGSFGAVADAASGLSRGVGGLGKSFIGLAGSGGPITIAIAAVAAFAAASAFAIKMTWDFVAASREYTKKLAEISALSGMSTAKVSEMNQELARISIATVTPINEVAQAHYNVVSAISDESLHMDILTAAMLTARATSADAVTTTNALTGVTNAYGLSASGTAKAANLMATAVKLGVTNMDALASTLPKVTPIAAVAGVTFDEVASSLSYLTKTGLSTAEAGTQLNAAISALIAPSKDMLGVMMDLGYNSGIAMLETEGLAGAYRLLQEEAGGTLEGLIGRKEAFAAAVQLVTDNFGTFNEAFTQAQENAVNLALANLGNKDAFEQLSIAGDALRNMLGAELAPVINQLITNFLPTMVRIIINQLIPAFLQFSNWGLVTAHRIAQAFVFLASSVQSSVELVAAPIRALVGLAARAIEALGDTSSDTYKSMKQFAEYDGLAQAGQRMKSAMKEFFDPSALQTPQSVIDSFANMQFSDDMFNLQLAKATTDELRAGADAKNQSFLASKEIAKQEEDARKKAAAAAKRADAARKKAERERLAAEKKKKREEEKRLKEEERLRKKAERDKEKARQAEIRAKEKSKRASTSAAKRVSPKTINNYIAGNYYELGSSLFGGEGLHIADLLGGVGDGMPRQTYTGQPLPPRADLEAVKQVANSLPNFEGATFNIYATGEQEGREAARGFEDEFKRLMRQGG